MITPPLPPSSGDAPSAAPAGVGTDAASAAAASAAPPAQAAHARQRSVDFEPGLVVAWVLAVVACVAAGMVWQKVSTMQEQLARQSAEAGAQSIEARTLARQAEETARTMAGRVAAVEGRVGDLAAYRAQFEDMVHSLARVRDENLAVELESALRVAQDQTQLTGSVEPLLAALRTAERRLARSTDPRLAPVGKAVARDLERVKTANIADTAGLLARIDQLLRQVDDLPLANEVGRARRDAQPREGAAQPPTTWWGRTWRSFLDEARGLLRVGRVERPEASMLSPEQGFFVRENLKLRLQGARLALLARQYEAARADLAAASAALGTWFDPASRRTQAAATLLQQVQALTRSADLPRVPDTLAALSDAVATTAGAGAVRR